MGEKKFKNFGVGKKIELARTEKDLTQIEFAKRLNISRKKVWRWETGEIIPDDLDLEKIAEITEKPLSYFLTAHLYPSSLNNIHNVIIKKVPIISWIHANKFESISDPFPAGISDEYILSCVNGQNIFALRVVNDCMEPEFRENDIVIINPHLDINNNDYVIVADRDENTATFKQYKQYGPKRILHPLNPNYPDIELDHKKKYTIVGKVVEKIKKY